MISFFPALCLLVAVAAAVVAGLAIRRAGRDRKETLRLQGQLRDTRRTLQQVQQHSQNLEAEQAEQEHLLGVLTSTVPEMIRQISSNREKRFVAPLLTRMVSSIFDPEHSYLFLRSADGESYKLSARAMRSVHGEGTSLEFRDGEGVVGWVARAQTTMAARDIRSPRLGSGKNGGTQAGDDLLIDYLAPLVDPDENVTLGVLAIGGHMQHQLAVKPLLKMVADLGSLSLKSSDYQRQLRSLANQDGLTGLYNKRYGLEMLSLAILDAERYNRDLGLFLFDIDHFKHFNDTNGHLAGDEVLRGMGALLREAIRADDFAVRFGGEEFLVVLHDTGKEGALSAAEKIRQVISEHPFPLAETQPGGAVTISGGVASLRTDSRNSNELIQMADQALYQAKQAGRNRVEPFRNTFLSGGIEEIRPGS